MKKRKASIGKPSLVNTVRVTKVEYMIYWPEGNKDIHTFDSPRFRNESPEPDPYACLDRLIGSMHGNDMYKARFIFEYRHRKTGKLVRKKYTKYYYVRGEICSKEEAAVYFEKISPEVGRKIRMFAGDNVFCIQHEVEPLSDKHDYGYLSRVPVE